MNSSAEMPGVAGHEVLASDSERDCAAEVLKEAFAQGRLTIEEHADRVQRVYSSRTRAELAELSADLPRAEPAAPPRESAAGLVAAGPARTNALAIASLVCALLPGLPQVAAIVMGATAHRQIRRRGERGAALATTGMLLASLGLIVGLWFALR